MSKIEKYLNGYKLDELFDSILDVLTKSNDIRRKLRFYKESDYLKRCAFLELNEICKKCFSIICKTIYELHGFDIKNKEQFINKTKESIISIDSFCFSIENRRVSIQSNDCYYNVKKCYFDLYNHYFTEDFPIEYLYMNEEEIIKDVSRIFYESKINKEKKDMEKEKLSQDQKIIRQNALNKLTEEEKCVLGL